MYRSHILFILLILLFASSCHKAKSRKGITATEGGYFSVVMFAKDQFNTYLGQPFTLQLFRTVDGKTDSSMVSAFALDWAAVLKPFFEADISDPKFNGKYNFSSFDDDASASRTYYYEAKDKDLVTRNLQIVTDAFTNKIKSVYIETSDDGPFSQTARKLFYSPVKVIQIQEFQSSLIGKDKNIRTEYRFLY